MTWPAFYPSRQSLLSTKHNLFVSDLLVQAQGCRDPFRLWNLGSENWPFSHFLPEADSHIVWTCRINPMTASMEVSVKMVSTYFSHISAWESKITESWWVVLDRSWKVKRRQNLVPGLRSTGTWLASCLTTSCFTRNLEHFKVLESLLNHQLVTNSFNAKCVWLLSHLMNNDNLCRKWPGS